MACLRGRGRRYRCLTVLGTLLLILWFCEYAIYYRLPEVLDRPEVVQQDHVAQNSPRSTWEPKQGVILSAKQYQHPHHLQNRRQDHCVEKTNFVYIKEIKCASQTLVSIFRRFGNMRNLSFVLPIDRKIYLGWPYLLEKEYYRPSKTGIYNVLCEHSVFDEERMSELMPRDTVYITGIREPFSQFKSMFNYYNFLEILKLSNTSNPVAEYLRNIDQLEKTYMSHGASKSRFCVPDGFSMSRNLMSYIMGFPTGFRSGQADMTQNDAFVDDWLSSISKKFQLVMITEYFHESLILLKRLMCWDFKDIIYLHQNVGVYNYKTDSDLVNIYRTHSNVDYKLYDMFNKTFWNKIETLGPDFGQEVSHYKDVTGDVTNFCALVMQGTHFSRGAVFRVHSSSWNNEFLVDSDMCKMMSDNIGLLTSIKSKYDHMLPVLDQPETKKTFC